MGKRVTNEELMDKLKDIEKSMYRSEIITFMSLGFVFIFAGITLTITFQNEKNLILTFLGFVYVIVPFVRIFYDDWKKKKRKI